MIIYNKIDSKLIKQVNTDLKNNLIKKIYIEITQDNEENEELYSLYLNVFYNRNYNEYKVVMILEGSYKEVINYINELDILDQFDTNIKIIKNI